MVTEHVLHNFKVYELLSNSSIEIRCLFYCIIHLEGDKGKFIRT